MSPQKLGLNDKGALVPVVGFDFSKFDEIEPPRGGKWLEAFELVFRPAPASTMAARAAALFALAQPACSPQTILQRWPGLSPSAFKAARVELESILHPTVEERLAA